MVDSNRRGGRKQQLSVYAEEGGVLAEGACSALLGGVAHSLRKAAHSDPVNRGCFDSSQWRLRPLSVDR